MKIFSSLFEANCQLCDMMLGRTADYLEVAFLDFLGMLFLACLCALIYETHERRVKELAARVLEAVTFSAKVLLGTAGIVLLTLLQALVKGCRLAWRRTKAFMKGVRKEVNR